MELRVDCSYVWVKARPKPTGAMPATQLGQVYECDATQEPAAWVLVPESMDMGGTSPGKNLDPVL